MTIGELGQSRDSLYDRFDTLQNQEASKEESKGTEEVKTDESAPAKVADYKIEETESSAAQDVQEKKPVEEKKEEVKEVKETKENRETKVPYDALHAEREKRKAAQARIRELENERNILLQETRKAQEEREKPPEVVEDYEKEILDLRREMKGLRQEITSQKQSLEFDKQTKQKVEIESRIAKADRELESEGYPLFTTLQDQVTKEITKMIEDDRENWQDIVSEWDTPDGWKKIYKEKVFPFLDGKFKIRYQSASQEEKKDLKKQAALTGGSAQKVTPEEKEEEYSYHDYLKRRKESLLR